MARSAAGPSGCSLEQPAKLQWPPRKATQNCPTRHRARSKSPALAPPPGAGGGGGGAGGAAAPRVELAAAGSASRCGLRGRSST
eukprot:3137473-Alexandrium_andersonii.AAC.1